MRDWRKLYGHGFGTYELYNNFNAVFLRCCFSEFKHHHHPNKLRESVLFWVVHPLKESDHHHQSASFEGLHWHHVDHCRRPAEREKWIKRLQRVAIDELLCEIIGCYMNIIVDMAIFVGGSNMLMFVTRPFAINNVLILIVSFLLITRIRIMVSFGFETAWCVNILCCCMNISK